jgi:recombination protein RecA
VKILDEINKKFGSRAAFLMGEESSDLVPVIPTGSFKLDVALGVGGVPFGRIIEVYGPESSGKTTLCQHIIAECQKMGGVAAFVDVEHSLDPNWLDVCGVNVDDLIVSQPDTGEQALDIVEMYVRSKEIDLVIVDSVAALVPKAEIEGEMGDSHMALQARLMSQAMRKLAGVVKQSNTCLIFTNQLRQKIGVVFGDPETTTGGMALRFYAAIRIDLRKSERIKDKDDVTGNEVKATIKKNKVAPPYKIAKFEIRYDEGISKLQELIDYGIEYKLIEKTSSQGGWFTIGDKKIQGMPSLRALLREDVSVLQTIEDRVRGNLGLPIKR